MILPPPPRQHFAPEFAGEDELRVQVDLENVIPCLVRKVDRIEARDDAGVVDEDVNLHGLFLHGTNEGVERVTLADVAGAGVEAAPQRAHLSARLRRRPPPYSG